MKEKPSRKIYVFIAAMIALNSATGPAIMPGYVLTYSHKRAQEHMEKMLAKAFPEEDGWSDHNFSLVQLDETLIDALCKHNQKFSNELPWFVPDDAVKVH